MDSKIDGAQTDAWGAVSGAIDVLKGSDPFFQDVTVTFFLFKQKP